MGFRVFLPISEGGLPASEITIPQVLKKANYTSSLVHRGGEGEGEGEAKGDEGEKGRGERVKERRKKEGGEGSKDSKRRGEILTPSYFSAPLTDREVAHWSCRLPPNPARLRRVLWPPLPAG